MSLPIVKNLSGPQESIFSLSRGPQLHFGEKSNKISNFIKFTDFPNFPLFGVPWAAVIPSTTLSIWLGSGIMEGRRTLLRLARSEKVLVYVDCKYLELAEEQVLNDLCGPDSYVVLAVT